MQPFHNIAEYLVKQRKISGLSQEELADNLRAHSEEFSELDSLTVSRWERGKVSPSLRRQVELILFFGGQPHLLLGDPGFSIKNLQGISRFQRLLLERGKVKTLIGAHPYLPHLDFEFDRVILDGELAQQSAVHLVSYQNNVSWGEDHWAVEQVKRLQSFPSSLMVYYFYEGIIAGHLVAIKLQPRYFEQLMSGDILDEDISTCMLADKDEAGCLFVISAYHGGGHISEDIYCQLFQHVGEDEHILSFGLKVRTDLGVKLLNFINHSVIGYGTEVNDAKAGVKLGNKRVSYILGFVARNDLLSCTTLLNLYRGKRST